MNHHASHGQMDHHNHAESETSPKEYAKFIAVILGIFVAAGILSNFFGGLNLTNYLRMFMGTFFLVFSTFKLLDLKGFAMSFMGYDIIAKRFSSYAYVYPFLELGLAIGYFIGWRTTDWFTLILMTIGAIGVFKELSRDSKIKCACLGTFIKLPLTTVSLIENLSMGLMALLMLLKVL